MNKHTILVVGGTFDDKGGKPSKVILELYYGARNAAGTAASCLINGGTYDSLVKIVSDMDHFGIIFWFPNVPNDKAKIVDQVKKMYPRTIVATSKRNDAEEYSLMEVINHALKLKSNLVVQFHRTYSEQYGIRISGEVHDPLGNCWALRTYDFTHVGEMLAQRAYELADMTRQATVYRPTKHPPIMREDERFFELVRSYADTFHKLIHPAEGVERFLGNTSFRCTHGFPSKREGDIIYMSRRNMDKRRIDKFSFVPVVWNKEENVIYYGSSRGRQQHKPSVDTPIQVRLYDYLPSINYMLHSHVFLEGADFTSEIIPCGALEEYHEICGHFPLKITRNGARIINLLGHGSLAMATSVSELRNLPYTGEQQWANL